MACRNQGLRWDTTVIQAVTTHLAFFKENDIRPHLNRTGSKGQATRASPNDTNIGINPFTHGKLRDKFVSL
jgi:hypothetical protein